MWQGYVGFAISMPITCACFRLFALCLYRLFPLLTETPVAMAVLPYHKQFLPSSRFYPIVPLLLRQLLRQFCYLPTSHVHAQIKSDPLS